MLSFDDANDTKCYDKSCPATKELTASKIKKCGCKPLPTPVPSVVHIGFDRVSTIINESDEFVTLNLIQNGRNLENVTLFITVMMQDQPGSSTQCMYCYIIHN